MTPCNASVKKYLQTLLCFSAFAGVSTLSATTNVSTTADSGAGSLRAAILSINDGASTGPIVFTLGGNFDLVLALPLIGPNVGTIDPSGHAVNLDGEGIHQVFTTQPNTTLTIGGATGSIVITDSTSTGGAGGGSTSDGPGNGGGGALGAGGGIFVAPGSTVTLKGVSFTDCFAQGGNGGAVTSGLSSSGGGGGGGMAKGVGGFASSTGSGAGAGGGGGGGGYGGPGGFCSANAQGGGGGGGMLFFGGNSTVSGTVGGGGGGSDANNGSNNSSADGGAGATDFAGNAGGSGGTGGSIATNGQQGTVGSGGGGGGGVSSGLTNAAAGGDGPNGAGGAGGGGGAVDGLGGDGGIALGFGGGGGGGSGPAGGGDGGFASYFGGGGGGGYGGTGGLGAGGFGGFGGGGGGAGFSNASGSFSNGGDGGFGAGGGGGYFGGGGGFGGGAGANHSTSGSGGGGGAALGGTVFVSNGATLTIQDPFTQSTFSSATSTEGTGANGGKDGQQLGDDVFIMSSGSLVFEQSTTFTIGTLIASDSGAGGGSTTTGGLTMNGTGTLVLEGNTYTNAYTGSTTIEGGGTVQISSDTNLGAAANPVNLNSGTLETTASVTSPRTINLNGPATIAVDSSFTTQLTGPIAGTGTFAVNKAGDIGTLVLSNGSNSFSGVTTIAEGVLQITGNNVLSTSMVTDGASLAFSNSDTTTYAGSISGTGSLTMEGTGTLALSGTNTYGGTTTISSGTLQINGNSSLPTASNVTNDRALVFKNPGTATSSGIISGTGTLTVDANSTVVLEGANIYMGTTFFSGSGGTISISSDGNLGATTSNLNATIGSGTLLLSAPVTTSATRTIVVAEETITIDVASTASASQWSGPIIGQSELGDVIKTGPGTLILSNSSGSSPNDFGQLTISAGTVQINSNTALPTGCTVTDNSALVFDNTGTATSSGNISGSGTLTVEGVGGTVVLSGNNSYTGITTITAGTLQINGNSSLPSASNVTDDNALVFNNSGAATYSGSISGTGTLTMEGSGTLTLSSTNSYMGTTTVQAGTLIVNGSIPDSAMTVDVGGTLGGTGTVDTVILDGTISPGNSIGTISGTTFTFNPSSTYLLELNNTSSDQIVATGAVTIDGGTVQLSPLTLTSPLSSYTIITGAPVTENAPFTLVNPLSRFPFALEYTGTNVFLVLSGGIIPFHGIVTKGNAHAVAVCFDMLAAEDLPDTNMVVQVLDFLTPSQMAHAFNQMQPANFNNIAFSEENVAERIRQIYTNHFFEQRTISCPEQSPWHIWAAPFIEKVRQHGKGSLPGYSERFSGFTLAGDYRFEKHWMVTTGFSYASSEMHVPNGRTRAHFKSYAGTVGAAWTDTSWFTDALFSYLYSPVHAQRKIDFGVSNSMMVAEISRKATHREHDNQVLAHLGGGYDYKIKDSSVSTVNIYPFANLDYFYLPEGGYTEGGSQSLDLKVRGKSYDLLRPEIGAGIGYKGCFEHSEVALDLSASYVREFRFLGKKTKASFRPADCTFTVDGLKPENNLICPEVRLHIASPVNGFSLTLGYHGEYGAHFIMNAGEAEFRKSF